MEQLFTTVSSKGQMVIPASIRESLGIEPGTLILEPETLAAKLGLIDELCGITAGGPSGTEMLLEERRRERELELAKDGF